MVAAHRRLALLCAVLATGALGVPAATAQTIPSPESLPPVSQSPQVDPPDVTDDAPPLEPEDEPSDREGGGSDAGDTTRTTSTEAGPDQLPDTGFDAWAVGLLGATVLLSGLGLRLKTAPERF
ncbi:hypothetical protein [Conexibacter sp. SYSU D00693]|uniref:hypothetical protein n=1 Tax=Conexibacter sp. SYSU D00693 TaxID=2812560 RepID=UPI00196A617A|nr:hypothetical protein [Conexibacter sp. SYSU D00693]